jgi:hypothetical protein
MARPADERGIAIVLALMAMVLVTVLGGALAVLTATETTIAARFRDGLEAFYAAEGGIARAVADLHAADWDAVRAGTVRSSFADGRIDLTSASRDLALAAAASDWRPYAYGSFGDLLPGRDLASRISVVVWLTADPAGDDNVVVLRSHAFGPQGVRRMVEATVERTTGGAYVREWRALP